MKKKEVKIIHEEYHYCNKCYKITQHDKKNICINDNKHKKRKAQ